MAITDESHWDYLSENEGRYSTAILDQLSNQLWARRLIADINDNRGITRTNKGRLFELRFAFSLHQVGIAPNYEIPGEGNSTLDFGFSHHDQRWAVELMRLEETAAVRDATQTHSDDRGVIQASLHLSTNADDPRHSPEAETIKAVERICQKCERDGRPYKFPAPNDAYHAMLVDFRNFLNGPDRDDCIHVGLGGEYVGNSVHRMWWEGNLITGVFNAQTNLRGAEEIRHRVHFIGFVNETSFEPGAFGNAVRFIANPHLFDDADAVQSAIETWPLQPATVLNI